MLPSHESDSNHRESIQTNSNLLNRRFLDSLQAQGHVALSDSGGIFYIDSVKVKKKPPIE